MQYASVFSSRASIVAALSVAMLFVVASWKIAEAFRPPTPIVADTPKPIIFENRTDEADSDGDGVPDWQEFLLGTDPSTPDKQKADAALASSTLPQDASSDSMPETNKLVDKVVTAYTGAQLSTKAQTPEAIANQISAGLEAPGIYKPHTLNEVRTTSVNTKERAAKYQSEMRTAMEPMLAFKESEIAVWGRYISDKDPSALTELDHMADIDDAAANNIMKIVVPTDAAVRHLEAVNALTYFASTLHTMVKYAKDPIASLTLLRVFNDSEKRMNSAYGNLGVYYSQMRAQ